MQKSLVWDVRFYVYKKVEINLKAGVLISKYRIFNQKFLKYFFFQKVITGIGCSLITLAGAR